MSRERLPTRRDSEAIAIEHLGLRFRAHVSVFPDGRLGEVFIDAAKQSSPVDALGGDVAVLISLLLQHGMRAADIGHALNRDSQGNAQSIVGTIVDLLTSLDAPRQAAPEGVKPDAPKPPALMPEFVPLDEAAE